MDNFFSCFHSIYYFVLRASQPDISEFNSISDKTLINLSRLILTLLFLGKYIVFQM